MRLHKPSAADAPIANALYKWSDEYCMNDICESGQSATNYHQQDQEGVEAERPKKDVLQ